MLNPGTYIDPTRYMNHNPWNDRFLILKRTPLSLALGLKTMIDPEPQIQNPINP